MREIKFRAWDGESKTMIAEGFHLLGETTAFGLLEMKLGELPSGKPTLERVLSLEIMQFTGLKDKNGKEIYEGDIISMISYNYQHMNNIKWEVMYYPEGMSFKFHSLNDRKEAYEDTVGWHSFEVTGNIYENPLPPS